LIVGIILVVISMSLKIQRDLNMEFNVSKNKGRVDVQIIGPVDWVNSHNLEKEFNRLLLWDFKEAVFNLSSVPFISSSAIGKLLIFYKKAKATGRKIRIKGINRNLLSLFRIIKLDSLFPMEV